jgi:hypothetical protein
VPDTIPVSYSWFIRCRIFEVGCKSYSSSFCTSLFSFWQF